MSLAKQYIDEIRRETGYLPTWFPTVVVSPGTVGRITSSTFVSVSSLAQMDIAFEVVADNVMDSFEFKSANAVTIDNRVEGQLNDGQNFDADVGIWVRFSRANAVCFCATGCTAHRIGDLEQLEDVILDKYRSGLWDRDLVLVTEAVSSASATILVSSGKSGEIHLVSGGSSRSATVLASVGLQVRHERGVGTKIIAASGLTPLFRIAGVVHSLGKKPTVRTKIMAMGQAVLREIDYSWQVTERT